jgi:hypothetical protein
LGVPLSSPWQFTSSGKFALLLLFAAPTRLRFCYSEYRIAGERFASLKHRFL